MATDLNETINNYFAQERIRDRMKRAFDEARPPLGVTITRFRRDQQPDSIASTAYQSIIETQMRNGTMLDYKLAGARNVNFEDLFLNQENRQR